MASRAYHEVSRCRICGGEELSPVLSLGTQALTGVFPRSRGEKVTAGPVDLVRCAGPAERACGLVQLRQSYDKKEMYGSRYGYRSGLNPTMVRHLQARAEGLARLAALKPGDLVLDIGSNDGTLLKAHAAGPRLVGVDPSAGAFKKHYPAGAELIEDFFTADLIRKRFPGQKAKAVSSIAMFYDLDEPQRFVNDVAAVLADDGVWLMEQSYLPAMVEATAYDTICHEHLEYYGLRQIKWLAEKAGLKIVALERNAVNGGSFAVTLAKRSSPLPECAPLIEEWLKREAPYARAEVYDEFREAVLRHRTELRAFLAKAKSQGKTVLGYGASTKGNVVLQYCGLTEKDLPLIGEVNSEKFGCFTPGTLIPIVPEAEVRAAKPDYLFVMPWHFRDFIVEKEKPYLAQGGRLFFPLPRPEIVPA